jgi:hypothetical protein
MTSSSNLGMSFVDCINHECHVLNMGFGDTKLVPHQYNIFISNAFSIIKRIPFFNIIIYF